MDKEWCVFLKTVMTVMLVFFIVLTLVTQFYLASCETNRGNDIGVQIFDGMHLYREGTVVFRMEGGGDKGVNLYRNGQYAGHFGSGKIGIKVYENDVLDLFCIDLHTRRTVSVDSVSPQILNFARKQTFYILNKKITRLGIVKMKSGAR